MASTTLVALAGSGQALKGDEWGFAYRLATEPLLHAILHTPPGKYLIVLPMLFYKAGFSTIGIGDYLPYRFVGIALTTTTAALFLLLAARRVGSLLALPGAVLILFLGSSSEVTATALRIPSQIALVAGLELLSLERRDLRGDLFACALLLVSITSHPSARRSPRRRSCSCSHAALPNGGAELGVWTSSAAVSAWYVALREPSRLAFPIGDQLRDLPRFEVQSLAVMAGAATGVFRWPFGGTTQFLTPLTYALAAVIGLVTIVRAGTKRMPAEFWAILAALVVLLAAPAFAPGFQRSPEATRYIFPGVVMLLLLLSELGRGVRFATPRGRLLAGATSAVLLFAIVSNAIVLNGNAELWAADGSRVRAELTGLDLARAHVDPAFRAEGVGVLAQGQRLSFPLTAARVLRDRERIRLTGVRALSAPIRAGGHPGCRRCGSRPCPGPASVRLRGRCSSLAPGARASWRQPARFTRRGLAA